MNLNRLTTLDANIANFQSSGNCTQITETGYYSPMLFLYSLLISGADAAGFYFSDVGVRSFARGGAVVAGSDDLSAMYYNPAALINIDQGQIMVEGAAIRQNVWFDRLDYPGEAPGGEDLITEPITNEAPPFVIPHFGVAHPLGTQNSTFAFGLTTPYAPDLSYPPEGAQRYSLIDISLIQTAVGPSVAHRITPWLTLGASAYWSLLWVEQDLKLSLLPPGTPLENPDYDVAFNASLMDKASFSYNAGFIIEPPNKTFAIAAAVTPSVTFSTTGTLTADFTNNVYYTTENALLRVIETPVAVDNDIKLEVSMPTVFRSGVLVRPKPTLEIEVDFIWEKWDSIDELIITDLDMTIEVLEDAIVPEEDILLNEPVPLPAGFQNAYSIRAGVESDVNDRLTLRLGGLYETSAIPTKKLSVNLVDGTKFGYGVGGTWHSTEALDIDFGLAQNFFKPMEIRDSEVTQVAVDPIEGSVGAGRVIGDGDLESSLLLIGAGINWHFGNPRASANEVSNL